MKYAKLENGKLIFPTNQINAGGKILINPTPEQLVKTGYKELVEVEKLPDKQWYYQIQTFIETETQIIQKWDYVKVQELSYKSLVVSKIAEKYDLNDEIALMHKGEDDPDYIAYRTYVQECKNWATEQIEEYQLLEE